MVINGTTIVKKCKNKLIAKFKSLKIKPKLAIIVLNGLENQKDFLNFKIKFADSLGVETLVCDWSDYTTEQCLVALAELSKDSTVHGIIPQLPANPNIHVNILLENIPLLKDVDGLNPKQFEKKHPFIGASNVFITKLVKKSDPLKNKKILLVGRNKYFAEPLYKYLLHQKRHINMIRYSQYEPWMANVYDIIISTVNQPLFINCNEMHTKATAIDLTYYKKDSQSKPVGAFYGNNEHLKYFTPVPGGLGPLTVYNLFANLYKLIRKQIDNKK